MSNEILPLIDFSKVKKKKKKPQKNEEEEVDKQDDDLDDVVLTKKKGKKTKKKKEKEEESKNTEEKEYSNENEGKFTYEFLLKRIYNTMKVQNPNTNTGGLKLPSIQLSMVGKDRTCWMNFNDVAEALNRQTEHLFQYVLSELGCEGTIGGKDQANIKTRVSQANLQKVLTKYINDYVRCPNCKSFNTIIKKDQSTRLQQIYCEKCKSEKTIQAIKSRANAGKKKK